MNDEWELLRTATEQLAAGFAHLPSWEPALPAETVAEVLHTVAERLHDNDPYFHPLYAGQMLKPPHPVARLAYALAQCVNPNNHARDGGRASSQMEVEAIAHLAQLVGWDTHLGHLTSGGTIANLEALYVSRELRPGRVVASAHAHYTHSRMSRVLNVDFTSIMCDDRLRMSIPQLRTELARGDVSTVVVTLGNTLAGAVDPLAEVVALRAEYDFRIHVDAAYGGYFGLADGLQADTRAAFAALTAADSVAIDPHKHGLQPYGCGAILFRDPAVARIYTHDSPYTYYSSADLHLGQISLECSRAGAAAVALWATLQAFPLTPGGAFARALSQCRQAACDLSRRVRSDPGWILLLEPELDIVLFAPQAESVRAISQASQRLAQALAERDVFLATARVPAAVVQRAQPTVSLDATESTVLRSCLLKPEHAEWVESIWQVLQTVRAG
jgi:glutamate/tyrosine decarboxylase-like PLP-dependent enzyme